MKVLSLNYEIFVLMWVHPQPKGFNKRLKLRNILISLGSLSAVFLALGGSIAFAYKSSDLERTLCALYLVAGFGCTAYLLINGYLTRRECSKMFPKLQAIYDENKEDPDAVKHMEMANKNAEFLTNVMVKYIPAGYFPGCLMLGVSTVIYSLLKYNCINVDILYVPFSLLLFWDQNIVTGWILEITCSSCAAVAYFIINHMFISFFIGICLYHRAYRKYITAQLDKFGNANDPSVKNSKEILAKVVKFHSSAKEIFELSADLYRSYILLVLIFSMLLLTCCLFQLDFAIRNNDVGFLVALIGIICGASALFLYCFYGQSAHDQFIDISDRYYNANWSTLPVHVQKYFVIMIANAQQPLYYDGFGLAHLDLNTFLRIIRTGISYYMMFKALTE